MIMTKQFMRFALVGILSNGVLYLVYLGIVNQGLDPKLAMTITYLIGVTQTYVFNKKWSFEDRGSNSKGFFRYIIVYVVMYGISFFILMTGVDVLGFPHEIVQGGNILFCAILSFGFQKYWVFEESLARLQRSY